MAGIYIHIPFCEKACHYCNFHFTTSLKKKSFVNALLKEIELCQGEFKEKVSTIYFGGGTPSLLNKKELDAIINHLYKHYNVQEKIEMTLEANPNDLEQQKLKELRSLGFNRLSIGIQSFFERDLLFLNRSHTATETTTSIQMAQENGFSNLTIDLIYGIPTLNCENWEKNIEIAIELQIPHISAYALTIEPKTAFAAMIAQGKMSKLNEEKVAKQYETLVEKLQKNNYLHYEISNFGKAGKISQHNSNYWKGVAYLGVGPSAHSFDGGFIRSWNIANNNKYIKSIGQGVLPKEKEILNPQQSFNEYLLTSLRTMWGFDIDFAEKKFGLSFTENFYKNSGKYIQQNLLIQKNNIFTLSKKGKLLGDHIISQLFILE